MHPGLAEILGTNCVVMCNCISFFLFHYQPQFNSYWLFKHNQSMHTVYPKKYAHGFVVLCFVVVMQSFIMNSHEVFIHIHQGCFAGIGAIVRLPQCQWSKPDGYGKISQCITTTKHSKAKNVCIFLGIYCIQCACQGSSKRHVCENIVCMVPCLLWLISGPISRVYPTATAVRPFHKDAIFTLSMLGTMSGLYWDMCN